MVTEVAVTDIPGGREMAVVGSVVGARSVFLLTIPIAHKTVTQVAATIAAGAAGCS
ncbi:hypothetical protein ACFWIY_23170 [Streptomyces sioyaensis]|uniref:hypothetical protein n=1 Tax=Streptomyces sioyaensis TaxID=67364 RepID=UPI003649A98E